MASSNRSLLIAISAGGTDEELAAQGIGMDHVEELVVRLARKLLRVGHRLAFGGNLANPNQRLTTQLIDAAHQWVDENTASEVDVTKPKTWPMRNYSAWDYYTQTSDEQIHKLVGICHFVRIDPPSIQPAELVGDIPPARKDRYRSDALTEMRRVSALEADLRIVFAGRIQGVSGWLAGIFEEVVQSLELNKPVLVVGGLGGCARLIADYLTSSENAQADRDSWPIELGLEACANVARDATLTVKESTQLVQRMDRAKMILSHFRQSMISGETIGGVAGIWKSNHLWVIPSSNENAREIVSVACGIAGEMASR